MPEADLERLWPAVAVLLIIAAAFALMLLGWRARSKRQKVLDVVSVPPEELGEIAHREKLLYVATTLAAEPLERVVVGGLGFRARAELLVTRGGLVLLLPGSPGAFIPSSDIQGVGLASWAIDRGVGEGGLLFVRWLLGETPVDTYLRPEVPDILLELLTELSAAASPSTEERSAHD